jgi:hypothetical protein
LFAWAKPVTLGIILDPSSQNFLVFPTDLLFWLGNTLQDIVNGLVMRKTPSFGFGTYLTELDL